ncbi:MAG: amidase, partial [Bacteroidetes bacterium]|nr:amidase [Bacteroidota bacterium]
MNTHYSFYVLALILLLACSQQPEETSYERLGLEEITVTELQDHYSSGTFTARDVVQAYINRIEDIDRNGPALNSVITINQRALSVAEDLDEERQNGT